MKTQGTVDNTYRGYETGVKRGERVKSFCSRYASHHEKNAFLRELDFLLFRWNPFHTLQRRVLPLSLFLFFFPFSNRRHTAFYACLFAPRLLSKGESLRERSHSFFPSRSLPETHLVISHVHLHFCWACEIANASYVGIRQIWICWFAESGMMLIFLAFFRGNLWEDSNHLCWERCTKFDNESFKLLKKKFKDSEFTINDNWWCCFCV